MAKKHQNLEDRLFTFLDKDVGRLEKKIDDNTKLTQATKEQAEKTNGRVTVNESRLSKLEGAVFGKNGIKESNPDKLPPLLRDKKIQNILYVLVIAFLILVIGATNVDFEKVVQYLL